MSFRNTVRLKPERGKFSSPKRMKSAQLLVGVLFDDFTPKRSFSCKNGIKSRKWKQKIKKSPCTRSANGGCDTPVPIAPQSDVGSAHNLSRRQSVMSSCVCQSYGHFQHPVGEQWAPPCFFSVIAAHFLSWKTCRFSHPPKNGTKPNLQLGRPHTLSG